MTLVLAADANSVPEARGNFADAIWELVSRRLQWRVPFARPHTAAIHLTAPAR